MPTMYHEASRRLQDQFDTRRIADRLEQVITRTAFTDDDKTFIESRILFFLATVDAEGQRAYIAQTRILAQKLDGEVILGEHTEGHLVRWAKAGEVVEVDGTSETLRRYIAER